MLAASRKLRKALASLCILMEHGKFKSWMLEVVMLAAGQLTNSLVSGLTTQCHGRSLDHLYRRSRLVQHSCAQQTIANEA